MWSIAIDTQFPILKILADSVLLFSTTTTTITFTTAEQTGVCLNYYECISRHFVRVECVMYIVRIGLCVFFLWNYQRQNVYVLTYLPTCYMLLRQAFSFHSDLAIKTAICIRRYQLLSHNIQIYTYQMRLSLVYSHVTVDNRQIVT